MKITRSKSKAGYVKVPNKSIRDRRLSWKARGLLAYLLSHVDEDWKADASELAEHGPDGRSSVLAGLNELVAAGYVRRHKRQDKQGHWLTDVEVFDVPQPVPPKSGFPTPVDRTSVRRTPADRTSENLTLRTEDQLEDQEEDHRVEEDQNLTPQTPRSEPTAPAAEPVAVVEDRGGVLSDAGDGGEVGADERVPAQRDGDPGERRAQRAEERRLAWQAVTARARHLEKTDQAGIAASIMKALRAGWTFAEVTAELDRELPAPPYKLEAVFIGRLTKLASVPPATDPVDLTPCPVAGHYDYQSGQQYPALRCNACRTDVKAGYDPFEGKHARRHPDWPATYGFDPQALDDDGMPLDPVERADMFAKLAALTARLDMDEVLDRGDPEAAQVGAGEANPW